MEKSNNCRTNFLTGCDAQGDIEKEIGKECGSIVVPHRAWRRSCAWKVDSVYINIYDQYRILYMYTYIY